MENEKYIGKICPFCKTVISSDDEIMVCPACDTPHHKACWDENKGCTTSGCSEQHNDIAQETNPADVCKNCGAILENGQGFCPKCGTPKNVPDKNICAKCGAEITEGNEFCSKCGHKVGTPVDAEFNAKQTNKKKKNVVLSIVIAGLIVAGGITAYMFLKPAHVDEIILSKESIELKKDSMQSVSYTISPPEANEKTKVKWKSSNESVAIVDKYGEIDAVGEGSGAVSNQLKSGNSLFQ